jgi:hypothetical protein
MRFNSCVEWLNLLERRCRVVFDDHADAVGFCYYLRRFGMTARVWQM